MAIADRERKNAAGRAADADPIAAEVVRNALKAAANQTRLAILRTAFSPTIYDWQDFSTGLFDDRCRLLAQDNGMPGFLGALSPAIEAMVERSGGVEALRPGDVIMSTYAYEIGSHPQDMTIAMPIFYEDELVGYVGIKGHVVDIGQKDAMFAVDTTDTWQEGTIYPSVRLFAAGVRNDDLWRTMIANSRLPGALEGDVNAFLGGGRVGMKAVERIIDRHGLTGFRSAVELAFDHSEQVVREKIARILDGRYTAEAVIEGFDPDNAVRFEVAVEVAGSEITVDYTAAAPQIAGPFNLLYACTVSISRAHILTVLGGTESANEGHLRPIHVRTVPGTFVHATVPAPTALFFHGVGAVDAILTAMSKALPLQVAASPGAPAQLLLAYGVNEDGSFWGAPFNMTAGQGASPTHDGRAPLMQVGTGDMRAMSCESFESRAPFVIDRFELAPDSGGNGRFRGCSGIDFEFRVRRSLAVTLLLDGTKHPPGQGLHGGGDGRANSAVLRYPDGTRTPAAKVAGLLLPEGTVIEVSTGGGGGYGRPEERDPELVQHDLSQGHLTPEAARDIYPQAG